MKDYLVKEIGSIKEIVLGVGLAFSVATSLRLEVLPIGVGEILLVLWFILTISEHKKTYTINNIYLITVGIIVTSSILLFLGAINGHMNDIHGLSVRTALAYVFSWGLLWLLVRQNDLDIRKVFGWLIVGFMLSVLIAMYVGLLYGNNHIDMLFAGERVAGYWKNLSENRNQFALLVLNMPFIASVFLKKKASSYWRLVTVVMIVLTLAVIVRSDALWLGWFVGGIVTVIFVSMRGKSTGIYEYKDLWIGGSLILCAVLIIGYKLWLINVMLESQDTEELAPKTGVVIVAASEVAQVRSRFELLKNGLDAVALSPLVGFGPGSYSGDKGPFEGREAHNTLIDWATQAGIVGGLLLLSFWFWVLRYVVKYGEAIFIGLIVALGVFACFHYTLRQPLFWLMPALVLLHSARAETRRDGKLVGS